MSTGQVTRPGAPKLVKWDPFYPPGISQARSGLGFVLATDFPRARKAGMTIHQPAHNLDAPFYWNEPRTVAVDPSTDLFNDCLSDRWIESVVGVMAAASWHTYQLVTSRTKRLESLLRDKLQNAAGKKNIWWGIRISTRTQAINGLADVQSAGPARAFAYIRPLRMDLGEIDLGGISWAIVGGDRRRLLKQEWVLGILRQCRVARIPFCFLGWGGGGSREPEIWGKRIQEQPKFDYGIVPDVEERRAMLDEIEKAWPRKRGARSL